MSCRGLFGKEASAWRAVVSLQDVQDVGRMHRMTEGVLVLQSNLSLILIMPSPMPLHPVKHSSWYRALAALEGLNGPR